MVGSSLCETPSDDEDEEDSESSLCNSNPISPSLSDSISNVQLNKRQDRDGILSNLNDKPSEEPPVESIEQFRSPTNLADLPDEVLLRIFRWTIGSHLDTRILGRLACVSRSFRLLSQDPCLWRSICYCYWPSLTSHKIDSGGTCSPQHYGYASWRDMAIKRPHVLLDGCYLCRISYVRAGEAEFGMCYRPMHLVVYYRGIRFYPNGEVCMLTSSHTPNAVVAAMNNQGTQPDNCTLAIQEDHAQSVCDSFSASGNGYLQGTYACHDSDSIVCTLYRPRVKEKIQPFRQRSYSTFNTDIQVTFVVRFRLTSSKKRLHSVLHWDSYVIHTRNKSTDSHYSTTLDVSSDHFPPCHFSPVRSYLSKVAPAPLL